ncbi:hypothetical protein YQE_06544, partial [Dendroctonus ponderosae]
MFSPTDWNYWPFDLAKCQKRGLDDYVQIGGSLGLDNGNMKLADSSSYPEVRLSLAGFRKGFSRTEHIRAVYTLIEKCTEYRIPLHMTFVDYQTVCDSIETWAVLRTMDRSRIDSTYSNLIRHIYEHATLHA